MSSISIYRLSNRPTLWLPRVSPRSRPRDEVLRERIWDWGAGGGWKDNSGRGWQPAKGVLQSRLLQRAVQASARGERLGDGVEDSIPGSEGASGLFPRQHLSTDAGTSGCRCVWERRARPQQHLLWPQKMLASPPTTVQGDVLSI